MIRFYSGIYKQLVVFAEMEPDEVAEITIESAQGTMRKKAERYRKTVFSLAEDMEYILRARGAEIKLAYLCGCANLQENGISFLTGNEEQMKSRFAPHASRMQSLCGFIFYKEYYHIFYTWNPFVNNADLLYWGHAVSRDMHTWKELPLILEPAEALTKVRHRTGGAAGGSAEALGDRIRLFITRRIGDKKTGAVLNEYLTYVQSRDAVHISPEKTLHISMPNSKNKIFRDPKVTTVGGVRYMAVGSAAPARPAVLLYREKGEDFVYLGPLFRLQNTEIQGIEAPDFFELGRTKVALGTLLGFTEDGIKNPSYWFQGSFRDGKMRIRNRGRLDFGGDFHSPQTMEREDRRLLLGILGNGSLSMPRELFIKGGRLCQKPAREAYIEDGTARYDGTGENAEIYIAAPYRGELSFSAETDFTINVGNVLSLCQKDDEVFLETKEGRFYANIRTVRRAEFFVGDGHIEVFLNDEEAGTKCFSDAENVFKASFAETENVKRLTISPMPKM